MPPTEAAMAVAEAIQDALFLAGPFEDFCEHVTEGSRLESKYYLDQSDWSDERLEKICDFADVVFEIEQGLFSMAHKKITSLSKDTGLTYAPKQADQVHEIVRGFLMDNLPMFQVYIGRMLDAVDDETLKEA